MSKSNPSASKRTYRGCLNRGSFFAIGVDFLADLRLRFFSVVLWLCLAVIASPASSQTHSHGHQNNHDHQNNHGVESSEQHSHKEDDYKNQGNEQLVTQISSSAPAVPLGALSLNDLRTFVEVFDLLRTEQINTPSDASLFDASIRGLLQNTDAHAQFYSQAEYAELLKFTEDELADVGIGVALADSPEVQHIYMQNSGFIKSQHQSNDSAPQVLWRVSSVAPRSSAYFKNINVNDILLSVDKQKLSQFSSPRDVSAINQLLSGEAGSFVRVSYLDAHGKKHTVKLQRKNLLDGKVTTKKQNDVLIVKIPSFVDTTANQITAAFTKEKIIEQSIDNLTDTKTLPTKKQPLVLLDIRGNPGGVLDSAVDVAGLFLSRSPVVTIAYRDGAKELVSTSSLAPYAHIKLAVLADRYTASAAEVLALALKNSGRALLFGETTYGKGSVQKVWPLHDGRAAKFTVAHYESPQGDKIDGVGVSPSIALNSSAINSKHNDTDIKSLTRLLAKIKEYTFTP